jgi:hypothetical protein
VLNCPLRVYWKNNIKKKHPHAIQTETWKKQEKLRKQEIMLRPVITRLKMAWQKTLQISNTQYCPLKRCVEASCISLRTRKHQKLEAYSNDKFTHRWPNEKKNCSRQQLLLLNAIARRTTTCSNTDQLPTVPETTTGKPATTRQPCTPTEHFSFTHHCPLMHIEICLRKRRTNKRKQIAKYNAISICDC